MGACKKDEKGGDEKSAALKPGEMVTLSKKPAKIDPPAKMDQIPDGAWICDMGTVHFAGLEKGEGTCDICGMPLTQKGAKEEPAAADKPTDDKPAAAAIDGGANANGDHSGHTD